MLQKINLNEINYQKRGRKKGSGKTDEYLKCLEIDRDLKVGEAVQVFGLSRSSVLIYLKRLNPNKIYITSEVKVDLGFNCGNGEGITNELTIFRKL